jgi:hypothetical protein
VNPEGCRRELLELRFAQPRSGGGIADFVVRSAAPAEIQRLDRVPVHQRGSACVGPARRRDRGKALLYTNRLALFLHPDAAKEDGRRMTSPDARCPRSVSDIRLATTRPAGEGA